MDNRDNNKKIKDALLKRALGYDTEEVTEEYGEGDGEVRLVKRKVLKKNVPPDISAAKMLLEDIPDITAMSDEELETERQRLMALLPENERQSARKQGSAKRKSQNQ